MGLKARTPLRGLDSVAWASLEHAYGSAEDVPVNLRALLSKSADVRTAAFNHLENSIAHP